MPAKSLFYSHSWCIYGLFSLLTHHLICWQYKGRSRLFSLKCCKLNSLPLSLHRLNCSNTPSILYIIVAYYVFCLFYFFLRFYQTWATMNLMTQRYYISKKGRADFFWESTMRLARSTIRWTDWVTLGLSDSECPLTDGSAYVSSEGLGCSDVSSPVHGNEPLRRPMPQNIETTTPGKYIF